MMVADVPEDFRTITPQLVVKNASAAIDSYTKAFGANELLRNAAPDGGSIMHSELLLGDSRFFVVECGTPNLMLRRGFTTKSLVAASIHSPDRETCKCAIVCSAWKARARRSLRAGPR